MTKKKKPTRKKLPALKALRMKADHLWSVLILLLGTPDGEIKAPCACCGKEPAISAHHVFHKSMHGKFRYHPLNGIPICRKCHFMERRDPAPVVFAAIRYHGYAQYTDFVVRVMGEMGKGSFVRKRADFMLVIETLEKAISIETLSGEIEEHADASL